MRSIGKGVAGTDELLISHMQEVVYRRAATPPMMLRMCEFVMLILDDSMSI